MNSSSKDTDYIFGKPPQSMHQELRSNKYKVTLDENHLDGITGLNKISSALAIISVGIFEAPISAKTRVMHPRREFSDEDCLHESARLLQIFLSGVLQALPEQEIRKIEKRIEQEVQSHA